MKPMLNRTTPGADNGIQVLHSGEGGLPIVLLDGAVPGISAYGGGAHVWGPVLEDLVAGGATFAIDGAAFPALQSYDDLQDHLGVAIGSLPVSRCHVVANGDAGLAALLMARESPHLFAGVTIVDSGAAAPTGDGVENVTLHYPPFAPGTPKMQRWALERLSYSHSHVDAMLLQECERTAQSENWRQAIDAMSQRQAARKWHLSVMRAKARLFEACRNKPGIPVPVQVIWGTHDPLATLDQGLWLFRLIAAHQPYAQFHAVNRAGALPFREGRETFAHVVAAFRESLTKSSAATSVA
jgi:pimeloyl-ACP methyl ester carboxylesterase